MRTLAGCFLVLTSVAFASAGEPAAPLQPLAPFVNDMTFLVIRIDAPRLKPNEAIRRLEQFLGPKSPRDLNELPDIHAKFVRAGGKDIFLVFNMGDAGAAPVVIVTVAADANKQALRDLFRSKPHTHVAEKDGVFLVGPEKVVAAALKREPKAVPELAKAFAAVESSTAQALLLPPRPFLRAQEELNPDLPKELGGGPITVLTRGLQWSALGLDITPKLRLQAVAQASDADAAEKLNRLATRAVNSLIVSSERDVSGLAPILPILKPKLDGARLVLNLDDKAIQDVLTPAVKKVQHAAARAQSTNNLKQMALAMHNYHDATKTFPPAANLDQKKKPLLSWRVHILPYLEQATLYNEFKLDEPWDSEHNKTLIAKIPPVYQSPSAGKLPVGKTVYLTPAGKGMIFGSPKGMPIAKILDGTSNTVLIVEANDAHAVIWTQPDDYRPERKDPLAPLLRQDRMGFHAAFADGSVRMLSNQISTDLFWSLLTAAGGEMIPNQ